MALDLTKLKALRTVTVYWNRAAVASQPYSWQTPMNIPFVPDLGCIRSICSLTTDTTHIMIVNSNLDSFGNRFLQFRGPTSNIYEHYFIPDINAVRGGVATFEILWGSLVNNSQVLIQPDANVTLALSFQIEFYKF